MASVAKHYETILADVYSWMHGGFNEGIKKNTAFFCSKNFAPKGNGSALDLGAGCGFQSIPLARLGYSVTAIDFDKKLLTELENHATGLPIRIVQDDLLNFEQAIGCEVELAICMTDTILHLASKDEVTLLFSRVYSALMQGGQFVITFRDLTQALMETDRFLPIRSDRNFIFLCFLEYESETVKVHDLIYTNEEAGWVLRKSFYRKLRLSKDWVAAQLQHSGFGKLDIETENGLVTFIASK